MLYIILGIAAFMFAVGLRYGYSWTQMFENFPALVDTPIAQTK
ncbi:hypothetical protein [Nostoc sp. FACHB-888]|nr:hypothetical protein [Nostoc sp. FACHB-888]